MTPLPLASASVHAEFVTWLDRFSAFVRDVDYVSARPLFHPDVLAFGTHRDVIGGVDQWMAAQWDNVWPRTDGFRFDLDQTRVLVADDGRMATVIAPWNSIGFHEDGSKFERPGRATLVFHRVDGNWLCVHSHMSLNRGVPQASFGSRPVKGS